MMSEKSATLEETWYRFTWDKAIRDFRALRFEGQISRFWIYKTITS